jgi:perosamine synthetase
MSVSAAERHARRGPILEQYLEVGFNYRMTDIQAAVGLVQLGRLHDIVARRRQLGARYRGLLSPIPGIEMIQDPPDATTNFQSFWVLLPESFPVGRDELLAELGEVGISARRGIMAAHLEPAYAGHPCAPLPVTDFVTRRSLILPLFHDMSDNDQDRVASALLDAAVV